MDYKNLKEKELIKLCQERKIRFIPSMSKQEMIEILQSNLLIHPNVEIRCCCNKLSKYGKFVTENKSPGDKRFYCSFTKNNLKEKKLYEKLLPGFNIMITSQKRK